MKHNDGKQMRIVAIAPSGRGFGFAVFEGGKMVDWGVKQIRKKKNPQSLAGTKALLGRYKPTMILLDDTSAAKVRRSVRIQQLILSIATMARDEDVKVKLIARESVKRLLLGSTEGTKQDVAVMLAKQFPEELGSRLPPKRKAWMSEDYRMGIFDAVALCVSFHAMQSG